MGIEGGQCIILCLYIEWQCCILYVFVFGWIQVVEEFVEFGDQIGFGEQYVYWCEYFQLFGDFLYVLVQVFGQFDGEFGFVVGQFGDVDCDDYFIDWCVWMVFFQQVKEGQLFYVVFNVD